MLLAPANPGERMSQQLPSVKCSNCNATVPLTELGDHTCEGKSSPQPSSTQKPNIAQTSSLSLLPQRLQNIVSSNSSSASPSQSPTSQHISIPNNNHTRFPSTASSNSSGAGSYSSESRSHASSFTSSGLSIPPVDKTSGSRLRSTSTSTASSSSSAPSRPSPLSGSRDRIDSLPSKSPTTHAPFLPPPISPFGKERATSNDSGRAQSYKPPPPIQPGQTYPGMRPPISPGQMARPPMSPGPIMRPPISPGPVARGPMTPQPQMQYQSHSYNQMPRTPQPMSSPHMSYAPDIPASDVDTKTGGEAGMAGVGRRGFAAVARAAMFVATTSPPSDQTDFNNRGFHRPNAPGYLDINIPSTHKATETPPLSSSSEFSPLSPYPQTPSANAASGVRSSPTGLSPARDQWQGQAHSTAPTAPTSPHLPFFEKMRNQLLGEAAASSPKSDDDATTPTKHLPDDDVVTITRSDSQSSYAANTHRRSESSDDDSGSEIGLAYADSADGEEETTEDVKPPSATGLISEKSSEVDGDVRAERRRTRIARFTAASSAYSRSSAGYFSGLPYNFDRDSHDGGGNLDRAIEAVLDDVKTPVAQIPAKEPVIVDNVLTINGGSKAQRSNTLPNQAALPDNKQPKLPTRSKTETERARDAPSRKTRVCVRCETKITDGRWIKVDGGGILCERCWKNMYLPKCRRCNLPIERQAVSSSDGQLKGKYHKECFNCHTCQKPFPDKTFYVFDGKPLCGYHYHEANKSLCASPSCGQPIEGPCAVSHSGDRFHPEHLLCEYSGYPACNEKLVEYWEIEGRMLCEKHAQIEDDGDELMTKANKRMTRFIDLTAYGNDSDSDEDEDLR